MYKRESCSSGGGSGWLAGGREAGGSGSHAMAAAAAAVMEPGPGDSSSRMMTKGNGNGGGGFRFVRQIGNQPSCGRGGGPFASTCFLHISYKYALKGGPKVVRIRLIKLRFIYLL